MDQPLSRPFAHSENVSHTMRIVFVFFSPETLVILPTFLIESYMVRSFIVCIFQVEIFFLQNLTTENKPPINVKWSSLIKLDILL